MKSFLQFRPSAQTLALFSLGLWLASLPFVGIVLYSEQRQLRGFEILAIGWLSVFSLNFAWLANLLFFAVIVKILHKKESSKLAILAFFLSLDTFRLSSVLLDEGGGRTSVYGYGWGAVLWLSSFVLLLSVALYHSSFSKHAGAAQLAPGIVQSNTKLLSLLGYAGCALFFTTVFYFSIQDRIKANPSELVRLQGLAFKRGPVCAELDPAPATPLKNLRGSLKVVDAARYSAYPFSDKEIILNWGIPLIRVNGRDFFYRHIIDNRYILDSDKPTAPLSGTLYVTHDVVDGISHFGLRLVEAETDRIVFNRMWVQEASLSQRFCPDFSTHPSENEQPRKVLIEAFGSPSGFLTTR